MRWPAHPIFTNTAPFFHGPIPILMLGQSNLRQEGSVRTLPVLVLGSVALVGIAVACAPNVSSDVEPRMLSHFESAGQLYSGAAAGDLVRVQAAGWALSESETGAGMPANAAVYVEQLRAFARLASRAPDAQAAATAVSRVGGTCGSCHRTVKRGPEYKIVSGPPEGSTPLATRMIRHQWAADRMWEGLVGPSTESWRQGAMVLQDAPLFTDALTHDVEQYEAVTRLAWEVHDVGVRAITATDQTVRADLFGELLGTCATCHDLLGDLP